MTGQNIPTGANHFGLVLDESESKGAGIKKTLSKIDAIFFMVVLLLETKQYS